MSVPMSTRDALREILFPEPVRAGDDKHFTDSSADQNLDAVIIDLEMRGGDSVCIASLKRIFQQLTAARATLAADENGESELVAALTNITTNAVLGPDPWMGGAADRYMVPLDDIEEGRTALAKHALPDPPKE